MIEIYYNIFHILTLLINEIIDRDLDIIKLNKSYVIVGMTINFK